MAQNYPLRSLYFVKIYLSKNSPHAYFRDYIGSSGYGTLEDAVNEASLRAKRMFESLLIKSPQAKLLKKKIKVRIAYSTYIPLDKGSWKERAEREFKKELLKRLFN